MKRLIKNYTTDIPVDRTIAEIQTILTQNGARGIALEYDEHGHIKDIFFKIMLDKRELPFRLPAKAAIVFLGFAFHRQNLALLKTTALTSKRRIFATKGSFSQPDCDRIRTLLTEIFKPVNGDLTIADMVGTCAELFKTYRMSLS